MQDILIVYDSKTGNTEKVAKALAEAAGERCVLAQVDAAPAADDFAQRITEANSWGRSTAILLPGCSAMIIGPRLRVRSTVGQGDGQGPPGRR